MSSSNANANANAKSNSNSYSLSNKSKRVTTKLLSHWSNEKWLSWKDCPNMSTIIKECKIITCKAPLSRLYEFNIENAIEVNQSIKGKGKDKGKGKGKEREKSKKRKGQDDDEDDDKIEGFLDIDEFMNITAQNRISVGYIIDTTLSGCYYHDSKEWKDWDVEYIKLKPNTISPSIAEYQEKNKESSLVDNNNNNNNINRIDEIITETELYRFVEIMKDILKKNPNTYVVIFDDDFGVNNTGVIMVFYLVKVMKLSLEKAIAVYNTCRSPGIYSREHLSFLRHVLGSATDLVVPIKPNWDTFFTVSEDSYRIIPAAEKTSTFIYMPPPPPPPPPPPRQAVNGNGNGMRPPSSLSSSSASTRKRSKVIKAAPPPPSTEANNNQRVCTEKTNVVAATTIDNSLKIQHEIDFGESIQPSAPMYLRVTSVIANILGLSMMTTFPGCHPILLSNVKLLSRDFMVSTFPEGYRIYILAIREGVFMVDERMNITKINVFIPSLKNSTQPAHRTLMDATILKKNDSQRRQCLLTDIMCLEGEPCFHKALTSRLGRLQTNIIGWRMKCKKIDYTSEPFHIKLKDQFDIRKTKETIERSQNVSNTIVFLPLSKGYNYYVSNNHSGGNNTKISNYGTYNWNPNTNTINKEELLNATNKLT